ncbi:MAG: thiamine pyrophosphate-binding protein [Rhodospirillales bacterium]|nr:thiamine pyrophosphate-binding protein [Rhodospirillales bacterium]
MGQKEPTGRTGGQVVVDALRSHGIDTVFCVPGESFLPILDALYDAPEIAVIACRHEHGAAMMTEAYGKLTGRPAVCLVTRGPGACNAAIGVHTAFQDATPMLLLIGQVRRAFLGREAFQEVDLARMFAPLAKRAAQATEATRLPAMLADAVRDACAGRPGPVVLALPEDLLAATTAVADIEARPSGEAEPDTRIDEGLMERLRRRLDEAGRPLLVVGGGGWTEQARADIHAFATRNGLPVACTFRRHDIFPNRDPLFIGELGIGASPALVSRVGTADLLIAVGTRLGEIASQGYTLLPMVRGEGDDGPDLVHVHPDAAEPGRVFPTALAITAGPATFAAAAKRLASTNAERRRDWANAARADYLADRASAVGHDRLDLREVMAVLDAALPKDAIVTVDAGNFSGWPQRFLSFGGGRRLLGPCNGAMGYAVPAAIAAKHAMPHRTVVACVGDGGFGMTGQELATAMARNLAIVVLVFDNGMYGTIRAHQERAFPGRTIATALTNPDYAALASAYGASGETVARTDAFAPALARALAGAGPALIALQVDPEMITTRARLSDLRAPAGR